MAKIDFEKQLGEGSAELLGQLSAALGVKGKAAILKLIATEPAARRLAEKIIGVGSPAGIKTALQPSEITAAVSSKKAKVEF